MTTPQYANVQCEGANGMRWHYSVDAAKAEEFALTCEARWPDVRAYIVPDGQTRTPKKKEPRRTSNAERKRKR